MPDLPDDAYAYIADGGVLDEERKTVPRTNRHFPHHDEDGDLDLDAVKAFLRDPQEHGEHAVAHMMRHAQAALFGRKSASDDAHAPAWQSGAAPALLEVAYKAIMLAEMAAADRAAMERLQLNTKGGNRVNGAVRAELKALQDRIGQLIGQADEIERGEDGAAMVSQFRTAFELLDLEEVA